MNLLLVVWMAASPWESTRDVESVSMLRDRRGEAILIGPLRVEALMKEIVFPSSASECL